MRTIALEEHFATPGFLDGPGRDVKELARQAGGRAEQLMRDLCDIGEGRIAQMDAAGIEDTGALPIRANSRVPGASLLATWQAGCVQC